MSKITYQDKEDRGPNTYPEINKVTAANMNEIKASVNALYDGAGAYTRNTYSAAHTATIDEDLIRTNSDVVMYSAADAVKPTTVKNIGGSPITVTPNSGETIEGEATQTIQPGDAYTFMGDGATNTEII